MTVREAQSRIDSREFAEWRAFDEVQPFGDTRADFRIAQLCALIANQHRRRGSKAIRPADFMPFDHDRITSDEDITVFFEGFVKRHNARQKANGARR